MQTGEVRVGIGGWTYAPWRGPFYPAGTRQKDELAYASRHLDVIEINGTFYRSPSPRIFDGWAAAVPEGFVFTVKAPRYTTHRKVLGDAGESVRRFTDGGVAELGPSLGPILWQLPPTRAFDPADFEAFLALLPARAGGIRLRHAVEVRHASFQTAAAVALARRHGVAIVQALDSQHPEIADVTAGFVYARLMGTVPGMAEGYPAPELDRRATALAALARGEAAAGAALLDRPAPRRPRDVFAFVIGGHKASNPAAAMALAGRLR